MAERSQPTGAEPLVDAMLQSYRQLALIVDYMRRSSAHAAPGADAVPDVLRRLLCDVLSGLARRQPTRAVAAAATLLSLATDVVAEDLLLVPPGSPRCGPRGPVRPRRRR